MSANVTPPAKPPESADDLKRMSPVYIAVIVVEVLVLLGLWTFQTYFG